MLNDSLKRSLKKFNSIQVNYLHGGITNIRPGIFYELTKNPCQAVFLEFCKAQRLCKSKEYDSACCFSLLLTLCIKTYFTWGILSPLFDRVDYPELSEELLPHGMCYSYCHNGVRNSSIKTLFKRQWGL